jgi:hypothetical protein
VEGKHPSSRYMGCCAVTTVGTQALFIICFQDDCSRTVHGWRRERLEEIDVGLICPATAGSI